MADPTNSVPSNTPAETAVSNDATPSLEQIASEFSVDDHATAFNATPTVSPAPSPTQSFVQPFQQQQAPSIPDPIVDQEGYRRYMQQQQAVQVQAISSLQTLEHRLAAYERSQQEAKVSADIESAVAKVNDKLKTDPLMAELALEKLYRTDKDFKRIWDNRAKNPQAFDKALGVVAQKLAPHFAVRQDPQLTENQRAAKLSQHSMASTAKQSFDPKHKGLYDPDNQAEFDNAWEAFKRGMAPG